MIANSTRPGSTTGTKRRSAHGWSGVMLGRSSTAVAVPKKTRNPGAHTRRRPAICSYASQQAPSKRERQRAPPEVPRQPTGRLLVVRPRRVDRHVQEPLHLLDVVRSAGRRVGAHRHQVRPEEEEKSDHEDSGRSEDRQPPTRGARYGRLGGVPLQVARCDDAGNCHRYENSEADSDLRQVGTYVRVYGSVSTTQSNPPNASPSSIPPAKPRQPTTRWKASQPNERHEREQVSHSVDPHD